MKIEWTFSAQTMLDQLPLADQAGVLDKLARLEERISPDAPLPDELKLIGRRETDSVYSFLPLPTWRLAISQHDGGLTVIDVARPEQADFFKDLHRRRRVLAE